MKPDSHKKNFWYRITELLTATLILRDGLDLLTTGSLHQIVPIVGQLRGLLTDRSKNNPPLLVELEQLTGHSPAIYGHSDAAFPPKDLPPFDDMPFIMSNALLTTERMDSFQCELTLAETLDLRVFRVAGTEVTWRQLIGYIANKAGGAHWSSDAPEVLLHLLDFSGFGIQPLHTAIRQFAQLIVDRCVRLLRRMTRFELLFLAAREAPHPSGWKTAFEYVVQGAGGWTLRMNEHNHVQFGAAGLRRDSLSIASSHALDFSRGRYIRVSYDLTPRCEAEISLLIEEQTKAHLRLKTPIILPLDGSGTLYMNRSDQEESGANFGLSSWRTDRGSRDGGEASAMANRAEFVARREALAAEYVWMSEGTWGLQQPDAHEVVFDAEPPQKRGIHHDPPPWL